MNDGCDLFHSDGYVYNNGERKRRHFIFVDKIRVWEPKLQNISEIERLRYKIIERLRLMFPDWHNIVNELKEHGGIGHAYIEKQKKWREYKAEKDGIGFSWLDDDPEPLNQDIILRYIDIEKRMERYRKYLYMLDVVLLRSLRLNLGPPNEIGRRVRFIINDRNYWVHSVIYRGYNRWENLSWPDVQEEETIKI